MSKKRRTFSAELKSKIVLELLSGEKTLSQIASSYEVPASSIKQWKKKFLENASMVFDTGKATSSYKEEIQELKEENEALAKKLGKTMIEKDWALGKLKSLDLSTKKDLVEFRPSKSSLSLTRQCDLLGINRSSLYYSSKGVSQEDLKTMNRIDEIYTDISSTYGYRFMHQQLKQEGISIGENKVLKLMREIGIQAIYPKKKKLTSVKNHEHRIYPYALRNLEMERPNQVWSGDITYLRMKGGFVYLAAIIDWYSRCIVGWKISSVMDSTLVTEVLQEAMTLYGCPEIFNSDQGSQYTSHEHTDLLTKNKIKISMNGKGRSIDNIAIERFFRTLKYEKIYLEEYDNCKKLKQEVAKYINFYNENRFHSSLDYQKPMEVYQNGLLKAA